jgi:hypothetical protein
MNGAGKPAFPAPKEGIGARVAANWKDLRAASAERFDWRGEGEIAGRL